MIMSAVMPGHAIHRLDRALMKATSILAMLGIFALIVAIAVVVGDIVWRRIGGASFIGSVDLTQLSVMIAVSWSIPYAFSVGAHVSVDLLTQSLSARTNRILDCIASLLCALITGFLCWLSFGRAREIQSYGDVSQDLAIPMIWFWASLVLGLGLSVIVCLVRAARLALEDQR
ncbi:MAG: TRAP transporter small permease [Pseudomonadota bacterium]